jgi:hypothetical protein
MARLTLSNSSFLQLTVGDSIKIPLYYVDLELGQTLLRLLQQPSPVTQAATNVTSQAAVKVVLYPFIGGFPTAWEFILIIVVALLALSFLVSSKCVYVMMQVKYGNCDEQRRVLVFFHKSRLFVLY